MPGVLYGGKIYMLNIGSGNEVMDIERKTWSSFRPAQLDNGCGSCAVTWKQSMIVFGGYNQRKSVQVLPVSYISVKKVNLSIFEITSQNHSSTATSMLSFNTFISLITYLKNIKLSRCASCVARCIPPCNLCAYLRNTKGQTIRLWTLLYLCMGPKTISAALKVFALKQCKCMSLPYF
jgi:hypothetical protein